LKRAVCVALLALIAVRAWLSARTGLMGDEAFYWMCARRLDLAYADHPPLTALLVRLGTSLAGDTPFGVRWPFGLCGALLPVAVWALARRLCDERAAWGAAGLCLVMPLLQLTPVLASPDAPLLLLSVLTLLCMDRATTSRRTPDWLAAGICAGLGMATHYRFALVPAGILAWLVLTRAGRRALRTSGPWWAAVLLAAGCVPALLYNLRNGFGPLAYQFAARHTQPVGPRGFVNFFVEQSLAVTPLLFAALLLALVAAWRRARAGDERAGPIACVAGLTLAVYFLASPLSDRTRDHLHWPQAAYPPLLAFVPDVLRRWSSRGAVGRAVAVTTPLLGGAFLIACAADLATGALGVVPTRAFSGWSELARGVDELTASEPGAQRLLVADTYIAAAQLAFLRRDAGAVYTLDHPTNARHGRDRQFALWGLDESALARRAGADALLVVDRDSTRRADRAAWDAHIRARFERVEALVRIDAGERSFELLRAGGVSARPPPGFP
jgi:hypothetical protein